MPFCVESYHGQGYEISGGWGRKVRAKNLSEVKHALDHYFGSHGPEAVEGCPLCASREEHVRRLRTE